MGTRSLIAVIDEKENVKVAQYNQWDGYPDGQGIGVIRFLKNKELFAKFKKNLSKTRFLDPEKDEVFLNEYEKNTPRWSNEPDNRTGEQKRWFSTYITRDLGADILFNIANSNDDEILLSDAYDFGNDTVSCEWYYIINLSKNYLEVGNDFKSKYIVRIDLEKIPDEEDFLKLFQEEDEDD